jgi:BNR/Asp-box repeat
VSRGTRTPSVMGLYETRNGGNTWSPAPILQPLPGESVFAASNSAMAANQEWIWLGTSKARVLRTRTFAFWQSAETPLASGNDSSGVFSLAFRDQQHGVAVGGDYRQPNGATGNAAYSTDGGQHWSAAGKPPHGYRSAVAWDATHQAWITAGSNGSDISYDDGKTWQWLDSGNWNALSLPWVVGPHGQIGKLGSLPAGPEAATRVSR